MNGPIKLCIAFLRFVRGLRPSDEGRDNLSQLLMASFANFLQLDQILTVELIDELLKKAAISINPHIRQGAGRQKAAQAIEHFCP